MRILTTGEKGFLLGSVINDLDGDIVPYRGHHGFYGYFGIDMVIHFASPNDRYEFQDKQNMAHTMLDYSIDVLRVALDNNAKFVFASSKAAGICADDYGVYKKAFEQYIQAKTDNHLIYRIPSVYGSSRKKGLMKQLRLNDLDDPSDYQQEVRYLDIEDFRKWFTENLNNTGIIEYTGEYRINTIEEVENLYIKGV